MNEAQNILKKVRRVKNGNADKHYLYSVKYVFLRNGIVIYRTSYTFYRKEEFFMITIMHI